jgi:hypothetical protein
MTVKPASFEEIHMLCADGEKYNLAPHPDGKPWTKCCKFDDPSDEGELHCQCLTRKPSSFMSRLNILNGKGRLPAQRTLTANGRLLTFTEHAANGERFFCVHRKTDDGFHRECAGWAALYRKPS